MKKLYKRILAITLTLAMVVSSIAFYHTKVSADPIELTISARKETSNEHQLRVTWTNPSEVVSGEGFTFGYYINSIDYNNQARAANGWVWSINNPSEIRTMLDTVAGTNGGVDFKDGGDFSVIVVIYKDGNVYAQGQSESINIDPDVNTDAKFKLDRYEQGGTNTVCSWQIIGGAKNYTIKNKDTDTVLANNIAGNATWTQWSTPESYIPGDTYQCEIIAYDNNGDPINITNNIITLDYVYVGVNYDANFTLVEYVNKGVSTKCSWDSISGARSYEIINKDTGDTLATPAGNVTNITFTSPTSPDVDATYTAKIIAYDSNGDAIAITNSEITLDYYLLEDNINASFKFDRYENDGENTVVSWKKIAGAARYKAFNIETGEQLFSANQNDTWKSYSTPSSSTENDTYTAVFYAYDENGDEILIRNNEITVNYYYEPVPAEHTSADYSQAEWVKFNKYGSEASELTSEYYINSDHGLNTYFFGVYSPHSAIPYHSERTNCKLNGPAISVQWQNVKCVWINSQLISNPSVLFNNQGDCVEMSVGAFKPGINVVTFVMNNESLKTFGIKVEGGTTHAIRIDNTKVADVFDGTTYMLPSNGMTEFSEYGYYLNSDNTKVYAPGDSITVNGDLSFTGIDSISINHTNGAIIHMVKEEPGIAFEATIKMNNNTPIFNNSFKYGMLISTYDFFIDRYDANLEIDNTRKEVNCELKNSSQWNAGKFKAGILNLQTSNFSRDFVSRAYVKINYVDGNSRVIYGSNPTDAPNRVRNLKLIAERSKAATDYYNSLEESEKEAIDYFISF